MVKKLVLSKPHQTWQDNSIFCKKIIITSRKDNLLIPEIFYINATFFTEYRCQIQNWQLSRISIGLITNIKINISSGVGCM